MIKYPRATTAEDYEAAKFLFQEYAANIKIDLGFQKFDRELDQLESMYSLPEGGIILAEDQGVFLGCVGIRRIDDAIGELKRMYVRPGNQGKGIGKKLLTCAVELAKDCGYEKIRLDTLNTMRSAIHLYTKEDFYEIPPYYLNPNATAVFFEKQL
ncbi:MAG: GNAT family N-acetyltransferase [Bacteroidota bacterium]